MKHKINHKTLKFIFFVLLIIIVVSVVSLTDIRDLANKEFLQTTIKSFGALGFLFYIGIYAVGTIFFFPGTPLTITAGYLFGPITGTLIVIIGATIGASGAFFISKILVMRQ